MDEDPESWIKTKKWKSDGSYKAEVKIIKVISGR